MVHMSRNVPRRIKTESHQFFLHMKMMIIAEQTSHDEHKHKHKDDDNFSYKYFSDIISYIKIVKKFGNVCLFA